ncbi:hypothetical protein VP14_225 [Vibrio phage VPMCC14]|nr:hypothetical protein VP14_225 [Vibrio phage VPMCC14]
MKNNRKIEVGQVRGFYDDNSNEYLYVVLKVEGVNVTILPLTWEDEILEWGMGDLKHDIVVM